MGRTEAWSVSRPPEGSTHALPKPPCGDMPEAPNVRARFGRRRKILGLLLALLGIGGLLLHRAIAERRSPIELAPQTTLFYLEIRDPERAFQGLRTTRAWRDLLSGVSEREMLEALLAADRREWMELLRSPVALLITGLEWEGETLRPHLAVLWTTERSDAALRHFAEAHLPALARRAYGDVVLDSMTHGGTPIVGYRARRSERGFFWSVRENVLILATHPDAIRAILETAEGRRPSLKAHPRLRHLRQAVERPSPEEFSRRSWWTHMRPSPVWGWVSSEALARGAHSLPDAASPLLRDLRRALFSALAVNIVFALDCEGGDVVVRSLFDFDPKIVKRYRPLLDISAPLADEAILRLIPVRIRHVTVYRWTEAAPLAEALEETLTAALSEPFAPLLKGLLTRMRRAFGWDPSDTIADALGSALAVVDTGDPTLLLILEVRNAPKVAALIGNHLKRTGASVRERSVRGVPLFTSDAHPERAFAFFQGYLLVGHPQQVERVILACDAGETMSNDPVVRARLATAHGFEVTVTFEQEETARALGRVLERIGRALSIPIRTPDAEAMHRLAARWPPTLRVSALRPEGLWSESRSPLGVLSLALAVAEGERNGSE